MSHGRGKFLPVEYLVSADRVIVLVANSVVVSPPIVMVNISAA
jgi:hypothetical protein